MTDKPDPAKDAGRTDPAARRPHATLDLKATDVSKPAPAAGAAPSAASGPTASAGKDADKDKAARAAAGPAASAAAKSATAGGSETASKASAASDAAKASAASAKSEIKPATGGGSGGGGFFSHLAAGIVGGGLVYAGAAFLGPNWLPRSAPDPVASLSQRLDALEAAPKAEPDVAALSAKIADTESKLGEIDALKQSLTALEQAQAKQAAEAPASDDGESRTRLSKLEEQLSMLAASAGSGDDGRLPQLAALTGKIADLEAAFSSQVSDLRKSLPSEVDQRVAATAEASEAAKAAASRLDREMGQIRTEQARSSQRDEATKADMERLSAAVEAVKEEAGRLSSGMAELRSSLDSQFKAVSRPGDITAAINPVATKLAELEQNVQGVVKSEQSRKQNAERIVLSLELSNLKRALDRGQGQGYAAELAEVKAASRGQLDLAALERFSQTGVATVPELQAGFRPVMHAVIDADLDPEDGSVIDRLLAGAKSVVRVRKVSHDVGDTSTEAIVGRIETALNENRLGDIVTEAKALPPKARAPIEDWLGKVEARHAVDQAIASIESQLKASLAGNAEPAAEPPVSPVPSQN